MKKLFVLSFLFIILTNCEFTSNELAKPTPNNATVKNIRGVYVFLYSSPDAEYQSLGTVENDFIDQIANSRKGEDFWEDLGNIINTSAKNIDVNSLLLYMVDKTKREYSNVDGIVFDDGLKRATAIRFNL